MNNRPAARVLLQGLACLMLAGCAGIAPVAAGKQAAAGQSAAGQRIKECRNCPELVVLPAGATTPVTWDQWEACVRDNWCEGPQIDLALRSNPDGSRNPQYKDYGRGTRPAVGMSWHDAQRFVGWLNWKSGNDDAYRLPSEAEWEYAARAGTTTAFPWGDTIDYDRGNPYMQRPARRGAPYAATTRGRNYLGFRVAKTLD